MKKKLLLKPPFITFVEDVKLSDASPIQGFDIPINEDNARRIDRLVNDYETRILAHLNEEYLRRTHWSDRVADKLASFGGSWRFIFLFASFLLIWMIWNTVPFFFHFDNPPFILLNLILSFIAAFQAPIIMMSQNRQAARDKHEAIIDFAINYKAESEIDDMQSHLHRIEAQLVELRHMIASITDVPAEGSGEECDVPSK